MEMPIWLPIIYRKTFSGWMSSSFAARKKEVGRRQRGQRFSPLSPPTPLSLTRVGFLHLMVKFDGEIGRIFQSVLVYLITFLNFFREKGEDIRKTRIFSLLLLTFPYLSMSVT